MNIGWVLLNCLFSVLQIYIFLAIGVWSYYKGIINKQTSTFISKLIAFFIFPLYNMLELSRVATVDNMRISWLLMISTLVSLSLGFILSIAFTKLFKLDKRTAYSFSLLNSLPSLGSLPLVLGKALCISGGPLDGDPKCSVITGFLVIDLMIFQIQMFFTGYSIVIKDIELVKPFEEKLHYLWHIFLRKRGEDDIVVLDLFERYLKRQVKAKEKYREFLKEYRIVHNDGIDFEFRLPEIKSSCAPNDDDSFIIQEPICIETAKRNYFMDYSAIEEKPGGVFVEAHPEKRLEDHSRLTATYSIHMIIKNIQKYYGAIFQIIEENLNKKVAADYEVEKARIIHNLQHFPPKFPVVRSFHIDQNILDQVDKEFVNYDGVIKKYRPDFKLTEYTKKSQIVILGKVYYPPIIGCFLGLLIGLSGMRDIAFSSNHYLKNFFDIWPIITVVNVPFIYTSCGFALAATKNLSRDMILTKKDIMVGMLVRFIIIPAVGLLWIYIWKTLYGGIVEESKVIRFAMFLPFCLPVAAVIVVFLNIVNFYIEETAYQIFIQYISCLVFLTVLFLIYFITLGS
jgi:predicted permease